MPDLNELLQSWRQSVADLSTAQVAELEDHVRAEMAPLRQRGLSEREAFVVATMRCGRPSELAEQFARTDPARRRPSKRLAVLVALLLLVTALGAYRSAEYVPQPGVAQDALLQWAAGVVNSSAAVAKSR